MPKFGRDWENCARIYKLIFQTNNNLIHFRTRLGKKENVESLSFPNFLLSLHWLGQIAATGVRAGGAGEEYKPHGGGQTRFGEDHIFTASGYGVQCGKLTIAPDSPVD